MPPVWVLHVLRFVMIICTSSQMPILCVNLMHPWVEELTFGVLLSQVDTHLVPRALGCFIVSRALVLLRGCPGMVCWRARQC